jgi:esterase/lipase superfamily enzyme
VLLALLAFLPSPIAAQQASTGIQLAPGDSWSVLTTQTIYPATRSVRIDMTQTKGRSKGVRIGVRQGGIIIERVAIGYSNGQVHYEEPDKPVVLRSESDRMEIDVRLEERFIDTIDINYRIEGRAPGSLQLIIEAAQSPAGRTALRPPQNRAPTVVAVAKDAPADVKKAEEPARRSYSRDSERVDRDTTGTGGSGGARPDGATPRMRGVAPPSPPVEARKEAAPQARSRSVTPAPAEQPPSGSSRSPAGAASSDKPYATVDVFFGTDRKEEPKRQKFERTLAAFGPQANQSLTLGHAVVTVPKQNRQTAEITRPEWDIIVARFALRNEDLAKDFTIFSVDVLDKRTFLTEVQKKREMSRAFRNQAFVFVHGFNVSFDDALFRAAQITYDLDFDGVPFMFSWPSRAGLSGYILDRDRARNAQAYLKQFIEIVQKETGATKVHLIAHSMGSDPLLGALREMAAATPAGAGKPRFGEIILAAPDVTVDNYVQAISAIGHLGTGMTLYASSNDWALRVSSQLRLGEPIAGLTPPIVRSGVDSIDVSLANTDFFSLNHSTFADRSQLLKDMHVLLETGKRPPNTRLDLYRAVTTNDGPYWRYEPATATPR